MRQDVLALLDADTRSRLAAPGHDFTLTPARWDAERATIYKISCSACDFGLTRTVRDRVEAEALGRQPHSLPHRRSLALLDLLRPLLDDFARLHIQRSTGL